MRICLCSYDSFEVSTTAFVIQITDNWMIQYSLYTTAWLLTFMFWSHLHIQIFTSMSIWNEMDLPEQHNVFLPPRDWTLSVFVENFHHLESWQRLDFPIWTFPRSHFLLSFSSSLSSSLSWFRFNYHSDIESFINQCNFIVPLTSALIK